MFKMNDYGNDKPQARGRDVMSAWVVASVLVAALIAVSEFSYLANSIV